MQLAAGDQLGQLAEHLHLLGRGRLLEPLGQPEALEGDAAEHEGGRRHLAGFAAHHAVVDQHATLAQARGDVVGGFTAHRVDAQAHGRAAGGRAHALGQVRPIDQHRIAAFGLDAGHRRLAAHHVEGSEAAQLGQLNQVAADPRVGRVLDHPVTGLQVDELAEHQGGGRRVDGHHRQLLRIGLRQGDQLVRRRVQVADPGAAADRQQHQLADLEFAHIRAECLDPAHALVAADRRQRRQHAVLAGQGQYVGGVDRCGCHLDPHLACGRRGELQFDGFDHILRLRAACLVLGFEHRFSPWAGEWISAPV